MIDLTICGCTAAPCAETDLSIFELLRKQCIFPSLFTALVLSLVLVHYDQAACLCPCTNLLFGLILFGPNLTLGPSANDA